jgi:hypothetical protein
MRDWRAIGRRIKTLFQRADRCCAFCLPILDRQKSPNCSSFATTETVLSIEGKRQRANLPSDKCAPNWFLCVNYVSMVKHFHLCSPPILRKYWAHQTISPWRDLGQMEFPVAAFWFQLCVCAREKNVILMPCHLFLLASWNRTACYGLYFRFLDAGMWNKAPFEISGFFSSAFESSLRGQLNENTGSMDDSAPRRNRVTGNSKDL